ncbi:hypothetical protein GCM10028791_28850 [Echinicola sediminis]
MYYLTQLTEQDYEKMAMEINEISESKSENELFELIGNALHDIGLTVSTSSTTEIITPKMFDQNLEKFSLIKSLNFVADTASMAPEGAKREGRKLWKRIKEKLRTVICNDPNIQALLKGEGTLKDYLKTGIPLVMTALGLAALNPVLLFIVTSVFALIIKTGFAAYCEVPQEAVA